MQFVEGQLFGGQDAYSPTEEDCFQGKFSAMGIKWPEIKMCIYIKRNKTHKLGTQKYIKNL
jgi:hypothetical protein